MAPAQGSSEPAPFNENPAFIYKTKLDSLASTQLPYVLAEAMVNHKKMVHPPNL